MSSTGLECLQSGTKLDKDECLKAKGLTVPDQSEHCTVDCQGGSRGCVIGQWSDWSECTADCPSTRKRKRDVSHECSAPKPPPDGSPLITQVDPDTTTSRSGGPDSTEVENCSCSQYRCVFVLIFHWRNTFGGANHETSTITMRPSVQFI